MNNSVKVVHIESGLGNQMLSFCEYLVLKKLHPNDKIFIETEVYDITEANEIIKQWNGYELDRVFGINEPNIKDYFSKEDWAKVHNDIIESKWWLKNWNYPVYFTKAFVRSGLDLINIRGDFEANGAVRNINMKAEKTDSLKEILLDNSVGSYLRRKYRFYTKEDRIARRAHREEVFYKGENSIFTGQWLSIKNVDGGIEFIEKEVRDYFKFTPFELQKDIDMSLFLESVNGVAIHARRGDMLGCNGYCYKFGYFKRAVAHIRKNVVDPVFVFFCDPGSVDWCRDNDHIFGLDFKKDKVHFVDWHSGQDSYRDMQMMTYCKHNIITNSSFGWWASWLNSNPNKITISPEEEIELNTTYHC